MISRTTFLPLLAVIGALTLAGCSAPTGVDADGPEPTASSAEPSAEPTADSADDAAARAVPEACAGLDLAPGATLDGAKLGECVAVALSSYGSGRMEMSSATDSEIDVEFTYDPDYSFQGGATSGAGPSRMVFLDGEMWVDSGAGFVKGDMEAPGSDAYLAAVAGAFYRQFSDVRQTADLIAAQSSWTVAPQRESITLPGGDVVDAYKIVSDSAFAWNDIPVAEFVLWYGDDWIPVGSQGTVEQFGFSSVQKQLFYDLGAPVTITAPSVD